MLATFFFSFLNLNITDGILSKPDFVGLDNYKQLFKDHRGYSRFTVGHHQVRIDCITNRYICPAWNCSSDEQ
jgi:ABC-type sugar transport system permease subunit